MLRKANITADFFLPKGKYLFYVKRGKIFSFPRKLFKTFHHCIFPDNGIFFKKDIIQKIAFFPPAQFQKFFSFFLEILIRRRKDSGCFRHMFHCLLVNFHLHCRKYVMPDSVSRIFIRKVTAVCNIGNSSFFQIIDNFLPF